MTATHALTRRSVGCQQSQLSLRLCGCRCSLLQPCAPLADDGTICGKGFWSSSAPCKCRRADQICNQGDWLAKQRGCEAGRRTGRASCQFGRAQSPGWLRRWHLPGFPSDVLSSSAQHLRRSLTHDRMTRLPVPCHEHAAMHGSGMRGAKRGPAGLGWDFVGLARPHSHHLFHPISNTSTPPMEWSTPVRRPAAKRARAAAPLRPRGAPINCLQSELLGRVFAAAGREAGVSGPAAAAAARFTALRQPVAPRVSFPLAHSHGLPHSCTLTASRPWPIALRPCSPR